MKIEFYPIDSDDDDVLLDAARNGGRQIVIEVDEIQIGLITPASTLWQNQQGHSMERNPADYFELYLEVGSPYQYQHTTYQFAVEEARKVLKAYNEPQMELF